MKYEAEEQIEVDGRNYRSIWGIGTEQEIDHVLDEEAPGKGWGLYRREPGRVQLVKPPLVDEREQSAQQAQQPVVHIESDEEWRARTSGVVVPEGKVICAQCAYVDRTQQMHGFVKCGTAKAKSDMLTKHSWVSPVYPRECRDYAAPRQQHAAQPASSEKTE